MYLGFELKEDKNITPMLAQYHKIKDEYPDCLILYRLGDFYEMFYEDAHVGSKVLNIVLTKKKVGKDKYIPMCGIPYHSAESYITKLVMSGYKVAICEQLEDASKAKGIVKRDVIRVLTPGTYFENEKLKSGLLAIYKNKGKYFFSYLNLSTGEFIGGVLNSDEIVSFVGKFQPKEILVRKKSDVEDLLNHFKYIFVTELDDIYIDEEIQKEFYSFFKTTHIYSFGFNTGEEDVLIPMSIILRYVRDTQKSFLPFIGNPKPYREDQYVRLDYSAQKHLELITSFEGSFSLFDVIDRTLTGMGKRRLKFFLLHPLKDFTDIKKRQESVTFLVKNNSIREKIRGILDQIYDIERLVSKVSSNTSTPRDLVGLRESLKKVKLLKGMKNSVNTELLKECLDSIEDFDWLIEKLDRFLEDDPPIHLKEGGLIKSGVDSDLDNLRNIKEKGNDWLNSYQIKLREETGIQSLKIGFNKVMGFYIEVTKPNLKLVPDYFRRRQTLTNAERFITDELQSFEEKILSADEKIKAIEYEIFMKIREEVAFLSDRIGKTAQQVGIVDALQSLAQIAVEKGWTKPEIYDGYDVEIKEGYHPVIKEFMPDFVPNNLKMNKKSFFHVVTGPNMAGKSTFIRQSAIIILLAQIGSYIPAKRGKIGVVDAIFTRIGSGDALAKGLSTFMVEMLEMANIVNNATERSFIVLDEVGRGTSTYDGLSIGWAISEYLAEKVKVKTLFATHYHELTQLEGEIKGVKNFYMDIFEDGENIRFLYRVKEGFTNKSYGIHVAKLAGIKEEIIKRAYEILFYFEEQRDKKIEEDIYFVKQQKGSYLPDIKDLPLFKEIDEFESDEYKHILDEIDKIDIGDITPVEALLFLNEIKKKIKKIRK